MSAIPGSVVSVGSLLSPSGGRGQVGETGERGLAGDKGPIGPTGPKGPNTFPVGVILPFGGNVVPVGWLPCNGAFIRIDTNPELYAVIGLAFTASPDGVHFQVPDIKGRTLVGVGGLDSEPGWHFSLGQKYGARQIAISAAQMPSHQHNVDFNHNHSVGVYDHGHGFAPGWHDHGPHVHNIYGYDYADGWYGEYGLKAGDWRQMFTVHHMRWYSWMDGRYAGANWSGGSVANCGNMGGWTNWVSEQATNWHLRDSDWKGGGGAHDNVQPSLGATHIIKT